MAQRHPLPIADVLQFYGGILPTLQITISARGSRTGTDDGLAVVLCDFPSTGAHARNADNVSQGGGGGQRDGNLSIIGGLIARIRNGLLVGFGSRLPTECARQVGQRG